MSALPARSKGLRRAAIAFAFGLLLTFVPVPGFEFVQVAEATVERPATSRPVDSTELAEMQEAVEHAAAREASAAGDLGPEEAGHDEDGHELVADRVVAADPATEEFQMIAVALDAAPSEPVLVRVREDDAWSEWIELEHSSDHGPDRGADESTRFGTEPLWVGAATGYELSVAEADAGSAEVVAVRDAPKRVVVEAIPMADASTPSPPFPIRTRAVWAARPPLATSTATSVRLAVIHHTVSSNSYSAAQVPGILRSIQAYHMDSRGWSDIAYNFLVDKFGNLWEGRGGGMTQAVIGAHAMGFNTGSVGVALIGDHSAVAPSAAAVEAASRVVAWRLWAYGVDPQGSANVTSLGSTKYAEGQVVWLPRVVGHRDVGATSCPGSVYPQLPSIRNRAKQWTYELERLRNPLGALDEVRVEGRTVTLRGWTWDPDTEGPLTVHTVVGGIWKVTTSSRPRPDVDAARPGYGINRGFEVVYTNVEPGTTRACAYAINQGRGTANTAVGCRDVVVK